MSIVQRPAAAAALFSAARPVAGCAQRFDLRTFPADAKPRFVALATHGKRAIPAWGGALEPAEVDLLWAHVSSGGAPR